MTTIEIIGWLGTISLAICGFPQMIKSVKDGHATGISLSFIMLWLVGEILCTIYVTYKDFDIIQLCNYIFNIFVISIIFEYKIFPREKHE